MLWKNYGKAMEFLFWGSVRTLGVMDPNRFKNAALCFIMAI